MIKYPIRKILKSLAKNKGVSLVNFTGDHFLPKEQIKIFTHLTDLSVHLSYDQEVGIEIKKDKMIAFEGSNKDAITPFIKFITLAYFSRGVEEDSNTMKEFGLICVDGRRIYIALNENGLGYIQFNDIKIKKAERLIGQDRYGGNMSYNGALHSYGFKQREDKSGLPGVESFLEYMLE